MNILIIQEYGRNPENQQFRECLSLQRALNKLSVVDADVWGLGHANFPSQPDFNSYDIIVNLENYDEIGWVPDLSLYTHPYKMLWSIDAHVKGMDGYTGTFHKGQYDIILQATKDYVDKNSVWFPNCYDEHLVFPNRKLKTTDFGFCGSLLDRKGILDNLTGRYGLQQDIFVLGNKMVDAVNSYWIHFNSNIGNDINYRSFETIGCGTVLLTSYNSQYEELGFIDEVNCLMYGEEQELYDKIEEYSGKYTQLKSIIARGYNLAKRHTYEKRASQLIGIYERRNHETSINNRN